MISNSISIESNKEKEAEIVDSICRLIRDYRLSVSQHLERIVAELCDVSVEEMMKDTKHMYNTQARWLVWYALRYMTNDSYQSIARSTARGRMFTIGCICADISKMSNLISANTVWTKRWTILKRIIKESLDATSLVKEKTLDEVSIKVSVPRGVKVDVKQE